MAPPTSMYSMKRTSAPMLAAEGDQVTKLVEVLAAEDDGVELEPEKPARRGRVDAGEDFVEDVAAGDGGEAIALAASRG